MAADGERAPAEGPRYVKVAEQRPEGDGTGCLRPLGMCDLGGCCDICWYGQNNAAARAEGEEQDPAEPDRR